MPKTYITTKLIPVLEFILIESLEPRQNRKRGENLNAVEYIQEVDTNIKKIKMLKAMMDNLPS